MFGRRKAMPQATVDVATSPPLTPIAPVDLTSHEQVSAVLLDLTMPGPDGRATFRELRAVRADVPVVLVGGAVWMWSRGAATPGDVAASGARPSSTAAARRSRSRCRPSTRTSARSSTPSR